MSKEKSTAIPNNRHGEGDEKLWDTRRPLDPKDRVVTDAVHERFTNIYVFCEMCRETIIGDHSHISQHFNKSHYSDSSCLYCKGKVFRYSQMSTDQDIPSKEFFYHNCRDWY